MEDSRNPQNSPRVNHGSLGRLPMARTLATHSLGLLAYYDHPISTGPLEGTNNKIKTMQKQTYGIRDKEFLKLSIYALHLKKYALLG